MDVVERLGQLLKEAGFAGEREATLSALGSAPPAEVLAALGQVQDARTATLMALLRYGERMPREAAEEALAPLTIEPLVEAGLLTLDNGSVEARVMMNPWEGLIIVGDPRGELLSPSFVGHVTNSGKTVARLTVRRQVDAALDLGTGSGLLALQAAQHAHRVVGIDINPRALWYAQLNERLNGLRGIEWLEGNWLEPVHGQEFDLVLGNLPFAISPGSELIYRETATRGDELSREIVREAAQHLAEGGFATVLVNWIHSADDWGTPLREWVAGIGCDALLLRFSSHTPLEYALLWNSDNPDPVERRDGIGRWVDYLTGLGVERIGMGAVILRRRSGGANWSRRFDIGGGPSGPGGDQVERIFAGCDRMEAQPEPALSRMLLETRWRLVDDYRLDQTLVHVRGGYASSTAMLSQNPGLNLPAAVDPRVLQPLLACDGQHTLSELLSGTAVPPGLDSSAFHELCLGAVQDLAERGYLVEPDGA